MSGERETAIAGGIAEALDRAVALAFLVTAGLVAAGHFGLTGQGFSWSPAVREPLFIARTASIAAWDLGGSFLVLHLWNERRWRSRIGEAVLALIASLLLWRVLLSVAMNFCEEAAPSLVPDWVAAFAPPLNADLAGSTAGLGSLWLFAAVFGVAKEGIARSLFRLDERFDSPLCNLFAWHHRKDAVFTLLGTAAATLVAWGASAATAGILVALVKLFLLGSASIALFHRCTGLLLSSAGEFPEGEGGCDTMAAKTKDGERR